MVKMGFTRAFGTSLRRVIHAHTKNRISAFFAGLVTTGILQSSTATSLIVTSFAKRGFITTAGALAVIIGADVSTTLVAQVLSLNLSWLSPVLLTAGITGHLVFEHQGREKHIARAIIGLGLMLLALTLIKQASVPLKESETFPLLLAPLQSEPILAIIVAALFTWLLHSSLASVLLFVTFLANSVISFELGLLLVLGANLGGAIVPFAATYANGPSSRQVTGGNIIMRFIMILATLPFLGQIPDMMNQTFGQSAHNLLHFHTGINIALALVMLPFLTPIGKLCERIFPFDTSIKDPAQAMYLEETALNAPVVALAGAARETLRMAELVEKMLDSTIDTFENNDPKLIKFVREMDDTVDKIYMQIKFYMTKLSAESLDPKEADRYVQIMTYATNLEYAGDIIDKNLMHLAEKKSRKQDDFSEAGFTEIRNFHLSVLENMRMAQTIFLSEDPKLAQQLVDEKKSVRLAQVESSKQHFERLRSGLTETMATSSIHLDIIRDYRRINSYVTTIAYAILDNDKEHKSERKHKKSKETAL